MLVKPNSLPLNFINEFADEFCHFSVGQFAEDAFISNFFAKKREGFYVDAGAFHPKRYSNTYVLRKYMGWTGLNIDASQEAIALFEKAAPECVNVCAALDKVEQDVEFTLYRGAAHSTIDDARKQFNAGIEVKAVRKMRTERLGDVVKRCLPAGRSVDFLSIDVEGKDLDVLESFDWSAHRPELVCIEDHQFIDAMQANQRTGTYSYMIGRGYRLASHHVVSSFYTRVKAGQPTN